MRQWLQSVQFCSHLTPFDYLFLKTQHKLMSLLTCVTRAANELRFIPTEHQGVKESLQLYTKPRPTRSQNKQSLQDLELDHIRYILMRAQASIVVCGLLCCLF